MKKVLALVGLGIIFASGSVAQAAVRFEAAHDFLVFSDDRWEGTNRHFGFMFDIGGNTKAGFFFEEGAYDWTGDVGVAVQNNINTTSHLNGLRIVRQLNKLFSAGIGFGSAQIQVNSSGGTTIGGGGVAALTQTKPFVDVLGQAHFLVKQSGKVTSGLLFDVGYRFLDLNDVGGVGPAGEATIDDLNGVMLGAGVFIGF